MKIGLFGGSFNPPSNIHINLAKEVIRKFNLEKVLFVPVGDYYNKASLVPAKHRYNMLKLATRGETNLEIENTTLNTKDKLYAIDTFKILKQKYKSDNLFFIMGSDNFRKMPEWKDFEELINNYNIIVIERERKSVRNQNRKNILEFIPENLYKMNSTRIREMIKNNEFVEDLLDEDVYKYIKENKLYI